MISSARVNGLVARVAGLVFLAALVAGCSAGDASGGSSPTAAATVTMGATTMPTAGVTVTPKAPAGPACTVKDRYFANITTLGDWERDQHSPVFSACPGAAVINATVESTLSRRLGRFTSEAGRVAPSQWPSTITVAYTIVYNSPELLSVRMDFAEVLGGAQPSFSYVGLNFLVWDGTPIPLESLFTDATDGLIALAAGSRAQLDALLGADGDPILIHAATTPVLSNYDKAWAFTKAGLEITFQETQWGPYAIGAPVVVIPWSDLASVIAPDGPAGGFVR